MASILYPWAEALGLRYQGVLVSAIRGCDTAPKNDASKDLARSLRAEVLRTHVSDPTLSKSFIEKVPNEAVAARMSAFVKNWDHYPLHYVMHLVHAAEIIGYHHENLVTRHMWCVFYQKCCHKLHMKPETKEELAKRLEADEDTFFANQDEVVKAPTPDEIPCRHCKRPGCTGHCLGT